jgi:hypothetical protein
MRVSKQRKTRPFQDHTGSDKPDYAADLFRDEKKEKKKPVTQDDAEVSVQDRLDQGMVAKLAALKAQMQDVPKSKPSPLKPAPPRKDLKPSPVDDGAASFAELFDPQEKDESSFEDLLQSSKLDWRSFKE